MGGPCAALGRFFVNDDLGTGGCHWGSVVGIHSLLELGVSRHSGVESGLSEEIECCEVFFKFDVPSAGTWFTISF
jgi:hypothetical protein